MRHGAPTSWWCSATTRSAPPGAACRRSAARASCALRIAPDWWRHGRTELRPTACSDSDEYTGSVVSQSVSKLRHGLVNRAGNVHGMSWFPGTTSSGVSQLPQEGRSGLVLFRATEVRQVAGRDHELRVDVLHEGANRSSGREIVASAARANMEVGHVEDARSHRRRRLQ